ncbi:hypothetical protein H4582DRAFT_2052366 [Lactarius indigo]|nr:hypothetical protein H4582DRAFT_2052360 [Lactarius indigo]KAI9446290.1 hypothetical protein H4582DRAFT_2052366 [Lactarius indigo]
MVLWGLFCERISLPYLPRISRPATSLAMAKKAVTELTKDETVMLVIAAKCLAAIRHVAEVPTTAEQLAMLNKHVSVELKTVSAIFRRYIDRPKKPRLHAVAQVMGYEWGNARRESRDPDWENVTIDYIASLCEEQERISPDWHEAYSSIDLSKYLEGIQPKKMWWAPVNEYVDDVAMDEPADDPADEPADGSADEPADDPADDPTDDPGDGSTLPSRPESSLASATLPDKGKARADPPPSEASKHPYGLWNKKRPAPASPDEPTVESEETTPRKSGKLQVEVVISSPPRAKQRPRLEEDSTVEATGLDMCGPCITRKAKVCKPQANVKRLTSACVACATLHKTCSPPASWGIRPHWMGDARSASSVRTQTLSILVDAQIEALAQRVDELSNEIRDLKKNQATSIEENRRGRRRTNQKLQDALLMLGVLLEKQGVDSSSIPGIGQPASSTTNSPGLQATSSPGIPLSLLKLSDARSNASSKTSSVVSEPRQVMVDRLGGSAPASKAASVTSRHSVASHHSSAGGPLRQPSGGSAASRRPSPEIPPTQ